MQTSVPLLRKSPEYARPSRKAREEERSQIYTSARASIHRAVAGAGLPFDAGASPAGYHAGAWEPEVASTSVGDHEAEAQYMHLLLP